MVIQAVNRPQGESLAEVPVVGILSNPIIKEAISRVLESGCGESLDFALNSPRLRLLKEYFDESNLAEPDRLTVSNMSALSLGAHIYAGNEASLLKEAQLQIPPAEKLDSGSKALIRYTGEMLTAAAAKCLPDEAIEKIARFRNGTAEEQIEICHELYRLFISESQQSRGDLTTQSAFESIARKNYKNRADIKQVLPKEYGHWNRIDNIANCQGIAQMLAAFAKIADVPVVAVNPVKFSKDTLERTRNEIVQSVLQDLRKRDLKIPSDFQESLIAYKHIEAPHRLTDDYFHISVALQVSDGRWVLIDSHALAFGVISDKFELPRAISLLNKYDKVLPGVSVFCENSCDINHASDVIRTSANDFLTRSRLLERSLGEKPWNVHKVIETLIDSEEPLLIIEEFEGKNPELREAYQQSVDMRRYVVMHLLFGEDALDIGALLQAHLNPEVLEMRLGNLLSAYHCQACNLVAEVDQFKEMVNPAFEASNLDHHLATGAISYAISDDDSFNSEIADFMIESEFGQRTLRNKLSTALSYWDDSFAGVVESILSKVSAKHPLMERTLETLATVRNFRRSNEND